MKNKKIYIISSILALVAILLSVLVLNIMFKTIAINELFVAEWGAGDALDFMGTIWAIIGTIIGVHLSIKYAQQNYEDSLRKQVLPYLLFDEIRTNQTKVVQDLIEIKKRQENKGIIENDRTVDETTTILHCNLKEGKSKVSNKSALFEFETFIDGNAILQHLFSIHNVGEGAAINLLIKIVKDNTTIVNNKSNDDFCVLSLKKNDKILFHLTSVYNGDDILGSYKMIFTYQNIYGEEYSQIIKFDFKRKGEKELVFVIDKKSVQKEQF